MDRHVVTSFLRNNERFLVLKRSDKVSSYKNKWAGISGTMEKGESVLETAYREIFEETKIEPKDLCFVTDARAFRIPYIGFEWVVHPLLFNTTTYYVKLNWENVNYLWICRENLENLETVPKLIDTLDRLLQKN